MTRTPYQDIGKTAANLIRSNIDTLEELLVVDEPFCVWDVESLNHQTYRGFVRLLYRHNVLQKVGQRKKRVELESTADGTTLKKVDEYRWTKQAREIAETELEEMNTLPCGHRWHIYNHADGYGCKQCDESRCWSRETIKERAP